MNENKKNYLNKLLQDSNLEMQNNRFDLSLIKLQQILDEVPENSAILNLISVCYSNLDQYEKSIKLISKAIKLSPQEIGYYINKGNIYKKINKYKDAEKVYLEALKINGESPELLYNIGLLYSDEHNYKTAIDYYLKSLKLNPTNKYALNNLGTAFKELNKYEEAKKNYLDAISLDSFFSDAQIRVSEVLQKSKIVETESNKLYFVDFWATWCGPCVYAKKLLTVLQKQYPKDFHVISL